MDYLRLIWIVDYSGPRGAAWPRVSISEPLARAHLRLPPLLLCLRSSRTLSTRVTKPLSGVHSLTLPPPSHRHHCPPSPPLPPATPHPPLALSASSQPTLPDRLLASSSRFLLAERSSSVPTRRLGLRPITCLPVIRCCANPPLPPSSCCLLRLPSIRLAGQFPLCSRRRKTWRISGGAGNSQ